MVDDEDQDVPRLPDPQSAASVSDLTGIGSLGSSETAGGGAVANAAGSSTWRALRMPVGGRHGSRVWVLFGTDGRIGRATFWLGVLLLYGGLAVCAVVVRLIDGVIRSPVAGIFIVLPMLIGFVWGSAGLAIKRWHDRDKSGWWMFIALVPFIGAPWAVIETGFVAGTPGHNRYGDSAVRVFGR